MIMKLDTTEDIFRSSYRSINDDQRQLVTQIKTEAKGLWSTLNFASQRYQTVDLAIAKIKLEEAVMWAVKAVCK